MVSIFHNGITLFLLTSSNASEFNTVGGISYHDEIVVRELVSHITIRHYYILLTLEVNQINK